MSKSTILSGGKVFNHYRAKIELPLYVSIMPKGIRFYKNITIDVMFKNIGNNFFALNKDKLNEKIVRNFIHNDRFLINYMQYIEYGNVYLENFPTFLIIERSLAEHRKKIISSL